MDFQWPPRFEPAHIRGEDKSNHFHRHGGQWSRLIRVTLERCIQYASLVGPHPRRLPKMARHSPTDAKEQNQGDRVCLGCQHLLHAHAQDQAFFGGHND